MINIDNEDKRKIFTHKVIKVLIAIVISIIFTYVIINCISFSDMLDSFKISFKTETMDEIVKYYSFTLTIIIIGIYTALYIVVHSIINLIYNKFILKNKE